MIYQSLPLAATYGQSNYDNNVYSAKTTSGTSAGGTGGSLVNTGTAAIAVTAVAVIIIILALIVQARKKPKPTQPNT